MSAWCSPALIVFGAADVRPECHTDFRAVLNKLVDSVDADPVGLAGVQPKVSAATISAPTQTRSELAIVKLNPAQYPLSVENEHFSTSMGAACGLRVAAMCLLRDADGRSALLVNLFDRDGLRCIAQEDACQLADIYPASKYRIKSRDRYRHLVRGMCPRRRILGGARTGIAQNPCVLLDYRQWRPAREESFDLQPRRRLAA